MAAATATVTVHKSAHMSHNLNAYQNQGCPTPETMELESNSAFSNIHVNVILKKKNNINCSLYLMKCAHFY